MDSESPNGPLDDVIVLDLTQMLSGPLATMYLGDLGAEVVKIERPNVGDLTRQYPAFRGGFSGYFASLNRNKQSLELNLRTKEGRDILLDLVQDADVIVENYKKRTIEDLNIGYSAIREANLEIIYCSIKAFGDGSPYEGMPSFDLIMQAMSGAMSMTGEPDGQPIRTNIAIGDIAASMFAAQSILAALFSKARDDADAGEFIEISMFDSLLSWLGPRATNSLIRGEPYPRRGNRHSAFVPYDSFETADGYFCVGLGSENFWGNFCEAIEHESLVDDKRFETMEKRSEHQDVLYDILEDVFREKTTEEWFRIMRNHNVPAGPIYDTLEVWEDPHVVERGLLEELPNPAGGDVLPTVRYPVKFSQYDQKSSPPPRLGNDTEKWLQSLGLSENQIGALRKNGVI